MHISDHPQSLIIVKESVLPDTEFHKFKILIKDILFEIFNANLISLCLKFKQDISFIYSQIENTVL